MPAAFAPAQPTLTSHHINISSTDQLSSQRNLGLLTREGLVTARISAVRSLASIIISPALLRFLSCILWALPPRDHMSGVCISSPQDRSLFCPYITPMRQPFPSIPPSPAELHISTESVSARPSVCFPASKGNPARPQIDSMVEIKPAHEVAVLDQHEEGKFRLLYSKSKVYVNPTVYSRDNIPGFVALVKRVRTLRASCTSAHVAV